ncbi:MAG TPA: hypothetical protein PKC91_14715 [Ignavibacteria bacterium]|nr:hypothetical protein [Ignavibacteria bacterium]
MKILLTFLFAILLFGSYVNSDAQVASYTFTPSSGVYTEIAGDTTVAFATTTTTSGPLSMDDSVYANNRLPFSFNFNGNVYTNVAISSNGFITFGTTLPSPTSYVPISATTAYAGAVSGEGNDLIGNRGITGNATSGSDTIKSIPAAMFPGLETGRVISGTGVTAGTTVIEVNSGLGFIRLSAAATASTTGVTYLVCSGSIVRGTTGSVGSRIHTIQFKNVRNFTSSANNNNYSFQIKLYETTNKVEIVYGNYSVSSSYTPQVGLRGALNSDFSNRSSTSTWAAPPAGGTNSATMTLSSTVLPASGQTYSWTPFVLFVNDVGTTAILNPVTGGPSGTQAPVATIKNFGSANQSTPFNITCTISPGGYSNTKSDTIGSGLSKNITFNNVNLSPNVLYTVTVYTSLGSDQNRANDTQRVSVSLVSANYGNDSGYFYANNLATDQPSWPDYCWKDTTGSKNLVLNGVNAGGTLVGSLDDGYFVLSLKSILAAYGQDTNKTLKYNGVCYDSIFPASNGMVGFTQKFGVTSLSSWNVDGALAPDNAFLAFWHDFNLGTITNQLENRLSYKVSGNQLIFTYSKIAAFAPTTDWASFQVIFELVNNCAAPNSNMRITFADTTNQMTSSAFLTDYLTQYPAASGQITTFRNFLSGYSYLGAPMVYAGYVSSVNPLPATPSTQVNVKRPLFNLVSGNGLAIEFGPNASDLNEHGCLMLSVSLSLQGPQSNPSTRVRDTVEIVVRDGSGAPYIVMQKSKVLLDSAYNNVGNYAYGKANIQISKLKRNNPTPLYLEIKNRNSVTSWSTLTMTGADTLKYNFTSAVANTYGGNAILVNGAASFYTGDVDSLRDGCIDLTDVIRVNNASNVFTSGDYVLTDLNWDGIVDLTDLILVYNNGKLFVCELKPPGAVSAFDAPVSNPVPFYVNDKAVTIPDPYQVTKEEYFRMLDRKEEKK